MPRTMRRKATAEDYERWAAEYMATLPLEHFMQSTDQSTQRNITTVTLKWVAAKRTDMYVFDDLLVQYRAKGQERLLRVVPDNMVVISKKPIEAKLSYSLPVQPAKPFWTLEYVSRHDPTKDYERSFDIYESALKVPYYLIFDPAVLRLDVYRHNGTKYAPVKENKDGRLSVRELSIEVALIDRWVRYWYKGKLLPLPMEIKQQLEEAEERIVAAEAGRQAAEAGRQAAEAENARLRALLAAHQRGHTNGTASK